MYINSLSIIEYFNIVSTEAIKQRIRVFEETLKSEISIEIALVHFGQ